MVDLQKFQAKLCLTVSGVLVHDQKVLLVKHKKLGIWLAPGGHVDDDELPHIAAEREFWEETGVQTKAFDVITTVPSTDSEYLPNPFLTNLHWISEENYRARLSSKHPEQRNITAKWKSGCEQHYCFMYLMTPIKDVHFTQNVEETDGIGWFNQEEIEALDTTEDIKSQLRFAFSLVKKH